MLFRGCGKKNVWLSFLLIGGLALGVAFYFGWSKLTSEAQPISGTVLNHPRPLPAFTLEGTQGYPVDNQHLQGHWTFLFMGFSHCASICPITMAELAKMTTLLSKYSVLPQPTVVMITLDPKRDSLERMKDYVESFHPQFIGARGTEEETRNLAQFLGIAYTQVNQDVMQTTKDYNIEHSGAIMLLNPKGELVAFFTPPHQADRLATDYQQLVK